MKEYNNPEEYIADVQKYIRWKRAKKVATRELYEHISDQYDALVDKGIDKQEAMKKAIKEMGSAEVVGAELDSVHRPQTNWKLLGITGLFLVISILVSLFLLSGPATLPKIVGIVFGIGIAIFLYFIDYTILLRKPKLLYSILSVFVILTLVWEWQNDIAIMGYSYTFYLLQCFPIVLVGILFQLNNNGYNISIIWFALFACCPLIIALLDKSFTAFIILLICEIFLLFSGLKSKRLKWNKASIVGTLCIFAVLIILIFVINQFNGVFTENTFIDISSFDQMSLFSVLCNASFIGQSSIKVDEQTISWLYNRPLSLLLYDYGILPVIALLMIFGFLFYLLFKTVKKQNTEIGKLLSNMVLLIFALKIVGSLLYEINIIPNLYMGFPFITTGGIFMIYDIALIGIILSICRNESIAKDWVKLKEKSRI